MAFNRRQANGLLGRVEMRLFEDSLAENIRRWDKRQLTYRLGRAASLRDRYQGAARGEAGEAAPIARAGTRAAARPDRQAAVFDEVWRRFRDRLRALGVQGERAFRRQRQRRARQEWGGGRFPTVGAGEGLGGD